MTKITTSKGEFILVQVPDGSMYYSVRYFLTGSVLEFLSNNEAIQVPIPTGIELEFLCTTNNATDESAAMFGICAITKDGTMYKYGVVANDGLPAAQGEKGWCWSDFEPTLQLAINKLLKRNKLSTKNNYAIIQKL